VFGVSGSVEDRKIMTKIPAKLFADFSPGGGLCLILISVLKYAKVVGWSHSEIEGILTRKQTAFEHVRLFTDALAYLTKAGLVKYPCIFIDPSFTKDERDALAGYDAPCFSSPPSFLLLPILSILCRVAQRQTQTHRHDPPFPQISDTIDTHPTLSTLNPKP
jgi:hypothetical protein